VSTCDRLPDGRYQHYMTKAGGVWVCVQCGTVRDTRQNNEPNYDRKKETA